MVLDTADTMVVDMDTTVARGLLMPNLRPKLPLLLNPKPMLMPTTDMDTDITAIPTDLDTTAIPIVISARGPLMLNPKLKLNLSTDTDTDITDIPTDMVDTMAVSDTTVEMDTSG